MCSGATAYSAIKSSGIQAGEWAVGIQGVQLAYAMGIRPIVVDTGAERKELSLKMGAEHFVDFREHKDPVEKVLELTNGGAHVCFVIAVQAHPIALNYLGTRAGGVVMWYHWATLVVKQLLAYIVRCMSFEDEADQRPFKLSRRQQDAYDIMMEYADDLTDAWKEDGGDPEAPEVSRLLDLLESHVLELYISILDHFTKVPSLIVF